MEQNGARAQMPVKRSKFADVQESRSSVKSVAAAAPDFDHDVPGISYRIIYTVSWTRFFFFADLQDYQEQAAMKAVEFYYFAGNNFEYLPSHIRVCLQELYCWRLVGAVSTLRRGLCF